MPIAPKAPPQQSQQPKTPAPINASSPHNPLPKAIPSKDLLQRLSFLYQANVYLASLGNDPRALKGSNNGGEDSTLLVVEGGSEKLVHEADDRRNRKRRQNRQDDSSASSNPFTTLSRISNSQTYTGMVKHAMLKTDPALKRTFCKNCSSICIPGLTSRIRVKKSKTHGNIISSTCLTCKAVQSLPAPPIKSSSIKLSSSSPPQSHPEAVSSSSVGIEEPDLNDKKIKRKTLDGPVRARRRSRLARELKFSEREAGGGAIAGLPAVPDDISTHTKIQAEFKGNVVKKGMEMELDEEEMMANSTMEIDVSSMPQEVQQEKAKKARRKKVKIDTKAKERKDRQRVLFGQSSGAGGGVGEVGGHSVWADGEVVAGWGVGVQ